jgi:hypothetical protein
MNSHIIVLLFVIILSSIFVIEQYICVPVTPFIYDTVKAKDVPVTKYCLCPVADPMGADEYSKEIIDNNEDKNNIYK